MRLEEVRAQKIQQLIDLAHKNHWTKRTPNIVGKLQYHARKLFPLALDDTLESYVQSALRVLEVT